MCVTKQEVLAALDKNAAESSSPEELVQKTLEAIGRGFEKMVPEEDGLRVIGNGEPAEDPVYRVGGSDVYLVPGKDVVYGYDGSPWPPGPGRSPAFEACPRASECLMGGGLSFPVSDVLGCSLPVAFGQGEVLTDFFNGLYAASSGKAPVDSLWEYRDRFCLAASAALMEELLLEGAEGFRGKAAARNRGIRECYGILKKYACPGETPSEPFWEGLVAETGSVTKAGREAGCGFVPALVLALLEAMDRRFRQPREASAPGTRAA